MMRRVLMTGTFDVDNYGDLLFPLVAADRLAPHGIEVIPVSPTNVPVARLSDAPRPQGMAEALADRSPIAGILIGGGYIVHKLRAPLPEYLPAGVMDWAYASLWMGATLAGAVRDVPVIWNAPGVPVPIGGANRRQLVGAALRSASHLAVRDPGSVEFLAPTGAGPIEVVPDTALGLARLWPRPTLLPDYRALLLRGGLPADVRTLAIHPRPRSLGKLAPAALARMIDDFARSADLVPVMLTIGDSFQDGTFVREISSHLTVRHLCLDAPNSLRETAAAIAGSAGYIGASMHGYVTAAAYDIPGVLVARPMHRKFPGLVGQLGRPGDLVRDWSDGFAPLRRSLTSGAGPIIPDAVHAAIDRHWQTVLRILHDQDSLRRPRQAQFLAAYMKYGLALQGADWAFEPFGRANP